MKSVYTYGVIPPKRDFNAAWKEHLGSREYEMHLRGPDCVAVKGTVFQAACNVPDSFSREWVYRGLKQLVRHWNKGHEGAGDFASSILGTLGIEWV